VAEEALRTLLRLEMVVLVELPVAQGAVAHLASQRGHLEPAAQALVVRYG
jgi:hypothetical protein